ncbi:hypothetical protein AMJ87_10755, partial [candidate division WOR_3 bacterium SM23_60]
TNPSSLFSFRYQYSADSGYSFEPSIRVSDTASVSHADFMGEYHICVSDSEYLYAIWTDGRNGDDNDLYFSKALLSELASAEITHAYPLLQHLLTAPTIWHGNVSLGIGQCTTPLDIRMYDCTGRFVTHLYHGQALQPVHITMASDDVPSGVLFIKLDTENHSEVHKVVNLR